jgi:hypothetical protein
MPRELHHRPAAASAGTKSRPITRRNTSDPVYEEDRSMEEATVAAVKGRPRKAVQDADAVERRRTQLRVAQRAFRKRRETTIEELREQVSSFRDANDDLLTSLRGFAERAVRKGLSDELAIDLCALLKHHGDRHDAEVTISTTSHSDEELRRPAPSRRKPSAKSKVADAMQPSQQDISTEAPRPHTTTGTDRGPGTEVAHASLSSDLFNHDVHWRISHTRSAPPALIRSLMPSTIIGFDETSFSIRIRRRALEVGYQ